MTNTNVSERLQVVFPYLLNYAAFFDKIVVSLWGQKRKYPHRPIQVFESFPIARPGMLYARVFPGISDITGNPFQLRYGRLKPFEQVPPYSLLVRSEGAPITAKELTLIMNSLMRRGYRAYISQLELTFDRSDWTFPTVCRQLLSNARRFKELEDERRWQTVYAGGKTSPWQVRVYQKTNSVVRVELILRREFLKKIGITQPEHVSNLRQLNIEPMLRLCEPRNGRLRAALDTTPAGWKKRELLNWPSVLPLADMETRLKNLGIKDRNSLFKTSSLGVAVGQMQKNLVW